MSEVSAIFDATSAISSAGAGFLASIIAQVFFYSIMVEVEQRETYGGWHWGLIPSWINTSFHQVQGFYLPDSIQRVFISYLIPFYLG